MIDEQTHVIGKLPMQTQPICKAHDWLIGECKQPVKLNSKALAEL